MHDQLDPYQWCEPGSADPMANMTAAAVAELYGVSADQIGAWSAAGLVSEADGSYNPFTVCNWLSDGQLARAPALARRWRSYLSWFRPFVNGAQERRRIHWQRSHRLYLPSGVKDLRWWLPRPPNAGYQDCLSDILHDGQRWRCGGIDLWCCQHHDVDAGPLTVSGEAVIEVESRSSSFLPRSERHALQQVCADFLSTFRYGYRRHRRDGRGLLTSDRPGSCLDAAVLLQRCFAATGRPSTVVGGIIARDDITNPHFWLEVATADGPRPVDITLPAIAAMLGEDIQPWLDAYVGGCDGRRITLSRGCWPLPGVCPTALSMAIGEVMITDQHGHQQNAWPCIDWVCGSCRGSFEHRLLQARFQGG